MSQPVQKRLHLSISAPADEAGARSLAARRPRRHRCDAAIKKPRFRLPPKWTHHKFLHLFVDLDVDCDITPGPALNFNSAPTVIFNSDHALDSNFNLVLDSNAALKTDLAVSRYDERPQKDVRPYKQRTLSGEKLFYWGQMLALT
ncbi:hypothetical protein EVAR_21660_1 [Eumeta japonica]|uniref:Uncharacterized protein n=1 Tax=Eumeta variegata TaxID=151549 RepID=A0A4C1VHP5_EUMVA|nr:hypothetical protein EVAR_21660_1 [Eumeta japonica]